MFRCAENNCNLRCPDFLTEVENFHIEKYMGGLMIYVIVREAGHHVMCTFFSTKVTSRCSNLQKLRDSPMRLPQDSDLNVLLAAPSASL
jgi:hypothetical protein